MRWKFIIPATLVIFSIFLFNLLFLDRIAKSTIISTGEMIVGAKVEIESLVVKFKDLSITISGFKAAQKNDPFKNLFEIEKIKFALNPLPLLSKKVIIEEMSVDGLRWATKRSTSGKLSPKKLKKHEKKNKKENKDSITYKLMEKIKEKGKSEIVSLPGVEAIKKAEDEFKNVSLDKIVTVADLNSIKEIEKIKEEINAKYESYGSIQSNLKIKDKTDRASIALTEASKISIKTISDIEPARQALKKLELSREELEAAAKEVDLASKSMIKDFGENKDIVKRLNDIKDEDLKSISSKLKLPVFSFGEVSKSIFGPLWVERVNNVIYYFYMARKYMPPQKKDKKVVKERMKGIDVSFPRENTPPDFHIVKMKLSGTSGGPGKTLEETVFNGIVSDITSDPQLVGRPTKIEITGTKLSQSTKIVGIFEHSKPIPSDSIKLIMKGISADKLGLPKSDYLPSFENSTSELIGQFEMIGDNTNCGVDLTVSNISVSNSAEIQGDEVKKTIAALWEGVPSIVVNAKLVKVDEKMSTSISSNIDKILSEKLKNMYGAKLAEIQENIKAEINKLLKDKEQELLGEFNGKKEDIQRQFLSKKNEINSHIDSAKSKVKEKEDEIKNKVDEEKRKIEEAKRKAENEMKKKAEDKLKDLFK